ncbi:MAG: HEPN domain-containing protein [Candidatus Hodarchaeaceae archaeon]|nr:HEPN domain-containing protein [Candidatus Hodarchaeaceae archaeon]
MDSKERAAYFDSGVAQLEEAKLALEHKRYALTAFLSAMSAESATSALIVFLGSRPSKKHRNSLVLHRLSGATEGPLKLKLLALIESMKKLEPHITKARYPVRKGTELLPPVKFYSANTAKELFGEACKVMNSVEKWPTKGVAEK